jgi:hypothetical protein
MHTWHDPVVDKALLAAERAAGVREAVIQLPTCEELRPGSQTTLPIPWSKRGTI